MIRFADNINDLCLVVRKDTITLAGARNDIYLVDAKGKKINYKLHIGGMDEDDYIENRADNVTFDAGKGNDTICNYYNYTFGNNNNNVMFKYNGFDDTSTLNFASGKVSSVMEFLANNDICVAVGKYTITLAGAGNDINLVDSKGKKINYTLHIVGTDEDDYIYSGYGAKTTIHGEAGNDTKENFYSYVTIDGGIGYADNDSIKPVCKKVTIHGGTGNNTLSNGFMEVHTEQVVSGYVLSAVQMSR